MIKRGKQEDANQLKTIDRVEFEEDCLIADMKFTLVICCLIPMLLAKPMPYSDGEFDAKLGPFDDYGFATTEQYGK